MDRTIVIGDIHGCFDELVDLLELLNLRKGDRVIAVGDLIVKGPRSRDVLDRFIEDSRFASVAGNQERVIRQRLRGEPVRLSKPQKLVAAELESKRARYLDFLRYLPFTISLDSHIVVHAGLRPGVRIKYQMASDMTEIRTMGADPPSRRGTPWYKIYSGRRIVLFGHWPAAEPRRAPKAIGLDTGCVYGGRLTGYILESREFVSVPARQVYNPIKNKLPIPR